MSSDPPADVVCRLDALLTERGMTLTELSRRTGITMANLSILKNNKAKAVRISTLRALCDVLDVTPGDIFVVADGTGRRGA
ncbi:helix-turn-helix transcriptional regulator [Sanguibacter sp. 25GB23B1]|uniref:helix-turn-helix domain-containing protein n=1 Tax=unclassified Sanguibacter TaxID=2645534 RepID=UPI0032B01D37